MSTHKEMVEKFICPGCVSGSNTSCGSYKAENHGCKEHVLGTVLMGVGSFALGMPKGFNRPGYHYTEAGPKYNSRIDISCFDSQEEQRNADGYNKLNIPVWDLEKDGYLFIRVFRPRVSGVAIHVTKGGKLDDVGMSVIDVSEFYDDID